MKIMKIKETEITETLLNQITERVVSKGAMICLETDDVSKVIVGKSGIMYEANQEKKNHSDFMKSFFNELAAKPQVRNSSNVLISIKMDGENPLMMEDMGIIHEFMGVFTDDTEAICGVSTNDPSNGGMALLTICTN